MWIEFSTMVISTMLSLAGVGLPQLNVQTAANPVAACGAQAPDSCLASDICDVFIAESGVESCALACDMRDLQSCAMDSNCAVVDGACDYADHSPVGC